MSKSKAEVPMFVPNLTQFMFVATFFVLNVEALAQSRYCIALANESAELEADWLTEHSRRLGRDQALLMSEYEFAPYQQIDALAVTVPPETELCRRAQTEVSRKGASLCYCRGAQTYSYELLESEEIYASSVRVAHTDQQVVAVKNGCDVYLDEDGKVRALVVALVRCH